MNISINIETLENIEELKRSFSAKFNLVAEWFDGRLTWNDLNDDDFLNIPDEDMIDNLWVPKIIFENTENKFISPLDEKAIILVKKQGNYTLASVHEMEEIAYYKGSENSLQYSRDFYLRFECQFELQKYPFDSQICSILLTKPSKVEKFMKLHPNQLNYSGPLQMAEFVITKFEMHSAPDCNRCDIQVKITLKRRVAQHLLSTYLPSLCILIIAQVRE